MENKFQKLTPASNVALENYEEALDFAFEEKDLRNIAVSGAYGAGKSSLLESYKRKNKDLKFIHVSLARFNENDILLKEKNEQVQTDERILEGKIINQLVHQIDYKDIPYTKFRIKRNYSGIVTLFYSTIFTIWLLMMAYLVKFDSWEKYVQSLSGRLAVCLEFTISKETVFVVGVIVVLVTIFALCYAVRYQQCKKMIKKLNIADNEIELFDEKEESLFDKYLDEVLYIFRQSNADAIVFEDLDRYRSNYIFQQLREINRLVNAKSLDVGWRNEICAFIKRKSQGKVGKYIPFSQIIRFLTIKPIKFIYLVKNDTFSSKEHTKFFDFIIPVVPVMDGSNSYDIIIEMMKGMKCFKDFDRQFLHDVSLYIDDMRLLKNIVNEFMIYSANIRTTEQDVNKLLAMVIYKNVFPRDFVGLQSGRGFVYNVFAQKEAIASLESDKIDKEILRLEGEISDIERNWLQTEKDVEEYYKMKINNASYWERDAINESKKNALDIVNNGKNQCENKREQIEILKNRKATMVIQTLKELINRENIGDISDIKYVNLIGEEENFNEVKGDMYFPLIIYLLRNGYIDETYTDYMSYFYENSISLTDKIFLRSIADRKKKEYTYALKNPSLIVSMLSSRNFKQEEILNFDILAYLLLNQSEADNETYLNEVIQQIVDNKNVAFIFQYASNKGKPELLFHKLNQKWNGIADYICNESNISEKMKNRYALATLRCENDESLCGLNSNGVLTMYISEHSYFYNININDCEKIADKMKMLGVKFKEIDLDSSSDTMLQCIYDRDLYTLSFNNICKMLHRFYCCHQKGMIHNNYTYVLSDKQQSLYNYLNNNMNEYIGVVLDNCNGEITDNEDAVVKILNNENIDEEKKIEYLSYLKNGIRDVLKINDDFWLCQILQRDLLVYSKARVLDCFVKLPSDKIESLFEYMNKHIDEVMEDDWSSEEAFDDETVEKWFSAIASSNSLNNKIYKRILNQLNRCYDSFVIEGLSYEKVVILIQINVIEMTDENLEFIRKNYSDAVLDFIKNNIDAYVNVVSENLIKSEEVINLIEDDISVKEKIDLLKLIPNIEVSIDGKNYEEKVKMYIVQNNFMESDLKSLIKQYDNSSLKFKELILDVLVKHIQTVIDNNFEVSGEACINLFPRIDEKSRWKIFIQSLSKISPRKCIQCLDCFDNSELTSKLKSIFLAKRPKIQRTQISLSVLEVFETKGWVSSIKVEENFITAYGRKNDNVSDLFDDK